MLIDATALHQFPAVVAQHDGDAQQQQAGAEIAPQGDDIRFAVQCNMTGTVGIDADIGDHALGLERRMQQHAGKAL
ncbi:hypothetical protein D3C72_2429790 [compost metagenome]